MISGKITPTGSVTGKLNAGGGTTDHNKLINRDAEDQHPIEAITGLVDELDSKLDSETALPIIEEAVKYKAKGLYYDAAKELATKAYWYLTSDIDSTTKQGTKASIISGPYDLGAGGGGGGGSVTTVTLAIATDPETGKQIWPYNVSVGSECIIGVTWTSTRDSEPTGRGTLYVYVAGKLVETRTCAQGTVKFDLTDYIISGENKIEVKVIDAYSTTKNLIDVITGITLKLASNFEDDVSYTGDVTFPYTPTGDIRKYVYFILDGSQYGDPEVVDTTGEQCLKIFPAAAFSHGSHTLRIYFTCTIDDEEVKSNELYYDIIYYESGRTDPIIASTFASPSEQEQYVAFNVKYRVYTPGKNESVVYLCVDSETPKELTVNTLYQTWENRFDTVGSHILTIRTGTVSKVFNVHVSESTIHVDPVTQGLALALSSYGRNNSEPLEERSAWNYTSGETTILGKLSGFNWAANGWVQDDDGNTVLRVSGDARVSIEYKPFETDFTAIGKTFEFELATSDVKNYETRVIECLDGSDTITYSQSYAGEDTRTKKFIVDEVDNDKFIEKVVEVKGTYIFICDGENWDLNGETVTKDQMESEYGITLKEIDLDPSVVEPSHYIEGDRVTIYYTVSGRGFYITPQLAKLQSQQASLSTQYKEDDKVRLAFVVEKRSEGTSSFKTRLIYMYINGILSGVSKYPEGDSFKQTPAVYITIGSNDSTIDLYNIRIYDNNLTRRQIVNNWIADTRDPVLKAKRYKHNDNYDDTGKISLDKIAALGNLPYLIAELSALPSYKKDRQYASITYTNPADSDRSFTATEARMDVQGTSSQYYYKKNFKVKYEGGFEDLNGNWSEHYKLRGDDSKKEKTFVYKADVASSEGANNVELVRYFEDTKNWYSPAEMEPDEDLGTTDSKKRIRVGIDGLPIVMFHNDGSSTYFYGKMNFNNDKGNERTFGFDDGDECWEFLHNTSDQVLFKSSDLTNWQDSFEARYPEENSSGDPYGTLPSERTKLQEILDWVVSTRRLDTDDEATKARKLNKFKSEFTDYFDQDSSLFYYLFTELFLLVDSRAKNAMLAFLKKRTGGDGGIYGGKWYWMPYDMDTALGINNEGLLVYSYDKEDTDTQEGAYIFNGQDSTFWVNLRDAFSSELKDMYGVLRSSSTSERANWSFDGVEQYFEDHQAVWSESVFNEDAYVKYLEPYINNQDSTYLGMAQGSKAEQRRWWLYNRFKYMDSKYLTGDAKDTTIMLRAYARSNFEVTPFINCYATAVFDQATAGLTVTEKAEKGVVTTIVPPEGWNPQGRDSVVILYSADILKDIGDISGFKPGYADFSQATKLSALRIGSSDPTYENTNLRGINVGANRLLTYIDARNCRNLGTGSGTEVTPTIDLSNCTSIEEVYFENTQIKGCSFPVGGNLKKVHLPETLTTLTIRNHPNLEDFSLAGTQFLTSLWLEDVPSTAIDSYAYVMLMPEESRIRLIGINNTFNTENEIKNFYDKLDLMHGIDAKGDDTEKPQVTGTIHVDVISYANYIDFTSRYPEVVIDAEQIICTVNFFAADNISLVDTQNVVRGNNAKFPKLLSAEPEDWSTLTSWDWEDGYIYEEDPEQFIRSSHPHYNNYYFIEDNQFKRVEIGTAFAAGKFYDNPDKVETDSEYYTFTNWDTSIENVQTNLNIYPVYSSSIRHFILTSDTQTPIISALPDKEDVKYNEYAHRGYLENIPESVQLDKWLKEDGTEFTFVDTPVFSRSTEPITHNITVYATWIDEGMPTLTLNRADYTNFIYVATDNVGIVGWACTNSEETPTTWNTISPVAELSGIYTIDHADSYYFWVKDAHDNITHSKIIASAITKLAATGSTLVLTEGETEITDYVLNGTSLIISCTLDEHYKNFKIYKDGIEIADKSEHLIEADTTFAAVCEPKSYTVSFDTLGKGHEIDSQSVVYLTKAEKPTGQYYSGEVIDSWYKDSLLTEIWDFDTELVVQDTVLYAKWVAYAMPTKITVEIPEDAYEIELNYYQETALSVDIIWNSNEEESKWDTETTTIEPDDPTLQQLYHTYTKAGTYVISMQSHNGYAVLGNNWINRAIMPISCVTAVEFSWDMPRTRNYAFLQASLTEIPITEYMTKISTGAFAGCTGVTALSLPNSLVEIGDQAFESCSGLTGTITIPKNVTKLGASVFKGCSNIESVVLNDKITILNASTFEECTALTTINIPSNITTLKDEVFNKCKNITELTIPETVNILGNGVFSSCYKLSKLRLLNKNLSIGYYCFNFCKLLNTAGTSEDSNIIYSWDTAIPDNAFWYSSAWDACYLESVKLPSTIKTIGNNAFKYAKIETITLPTKLESIGNNAFEGSSLTSIDIPFNVSNIGSSAFASTASLRSAIIRPTSSTTKIDLASDAWFYDVNAQTKLYIDESLTVDDKSYIAFGEYWDNYSDTDKLSWSKIE